MRIVLIVALCLSMNAYSCPELQGSYASCKSLAGNMMERKNLLIHQETVEEGSIYTLEETDPETNEYVESTVEANGKVISEIDPFNNVVIRTITYCENDELIMDSKYFYLGEKIGSMITVSKKAENRVTITANGEVQGRKYKDSIICE